MLLDKDSIAEQWDLIESAIEQALPPLANPELIESRMVTIKKMALLGDLDIWEVANEEEVLLIASMLPIVDAPTMTRNYMIYSLTSFIPLSYDKWFVIFKKVRNYCKSKGYYKIIAYTNVDRIVELVKVLGGKTDFKLVELEVE